MLDQLASWSLVVDSVVDSANPVSLIISYG